MKIPKVKTPPVIDGSLEEQAWKKAAVFTDFKTMHPAPGLPPSERTEVYLTYDRNSFYIGIRCFDSEPEKIRATATQRDAPESDDWVAFCLDTFNDELGAYFFLVTPARIQADGTLTADGSPEFTFNCKWASAVKRTAEGYIVEIAVPFENLSFQASENLTMGFKVARLISRKAEEVDFPEILPDRAPHLSQFQKIVLSVIERGQQLANALPITNVMERYRQKVKAGAQHDTNTLDGRCRAWGEASVIDYLLFPYHEVRNNGPIFYFNKNIREQWVASRFEAMEYHPDKRIENLENFLTRTQTAAFIVIVNDTIVYEKYFNGYRRDAIVTSFSVAKSFASTLVGIAIDEGLIGSVEDPIARYLPELKARDQRFARITIKDLLRMSAGLRYIEEPPPYRDDEITYYDPNLRQAALEKTEIVDKPGMHFLYNNYHPLLIGMILERATGMSISEYLQKKLWEPLGMEYPGSWSTDSETHGFEKMESGINARAIDFARFGRLFLQQGRWRNQQVVSARLIDAATQPEEKSAGYYPAWPFFQTQGGFYQFFWWGRKRESSRSDFFALGNKGQYIYVSPQKHLIIVRNGIEFGIPSMNWVRLFYDFASRL